jgi:hypothetical protein
VCIGPTTSRETDTIAAWQTMFSFSITKETHPGSSSVILVSRTFSAIRTRTLDAIREPTFQSPRHPTQLVYDLVSSQIRLVGEATHHVAWLAVVFVKGAVYHPSHDP